MTMKKGPAETRAAIRTAAAFTFLLLLSSPLIPPPAMGEETKGAAPQAASAETIAAAREIYRTRCVLCHGETGRGDGAGAMALDPKPRDLGDPAWQAAVTDEYVERIIARGGVAVGKSPSMPPNPDLQSKPEMVRALRELIRGFARK